MPEHLEVFLEGSALSRGIAIGLPFVLDTLDIQIPEITLEPDQIEGEIERYRQALQSTRHDLLRLKNSLEMEGIKDGASVLEAHVELTLDPLLNVEIEEEIASRAKNAEFVLAKIMSRYGKKFRKLSDPFFQQRFEIVQDIYKRILESLAKSKRDLLAEIPPDSIVFAETITPSSAAEANRQNVAAFVTQFGGAMSHMAIVAKAKGIPYVANVDFSELSKIQKNPIVIVDGLLGRIIVNPSEKTLLQYRQLQAHIQFQYDQLKSYSALPSTTSDGVRVRLSANVEMSDEFSHLKQYGAEGVGLFRSEYLVLGRGRFPSEEEQYEVYKSLVEHMAELPVVIRAFDLGMDKVVGGLPLMKEQNPALGARAIRFLLKEKELFEIQMRAVLRASVSGNARILFPMVSSVSELRDAKEVVYKAYDALIKEGYEVPKTIKLGCMVEVPSAAMIADLLARECDFLSIGTNDLIQYALAIDRTQHAGSALLTSTHPGVVRLIKVIVQQAQAEKVPVSVCGEMASDPRFVPLLIGLGITELSVASRFLPLIKHVVRNTSKLEAVKLADQVLSLKTGVEIQTLLVEHYQKGIPEAVHNHFLERLMYWIAIETATERALVALFLNDTVVAVHELAFGLTQSRMLLPALEELCLNAGIKLHAIARVFVGKGPGSYTGIRVGVACAKALSFALKIPLIGVSSLKLFCPSPDYEGSFLSVMDAKVGGVYAIRGIVHNKKITFESNEELMPFDKFQEAIKGVHYLVTASWEPIRARLMDEGVNNFPEVIERYPSATLFLEEGNRQFASGNYTLDGTLAILYLRQTQAEIDLLTSHKVGLAK